MATIRKAPSRVLIWPRLSDSRERCIKPLATNADNSSVANSAHADGHSRKTQAARRGRPREAVYTWVIRPIMRQKSSIGSTLT